MPGPIERVLSRVPHLEINASGRLFVGKNTGDPVAAPLAPTIWNLEHRRPVDRLESGVRWGIVLHWFGDRGEADQSLDAYLRGFDAIRPVFNYETRTSAHFLVGSAHPAQVVDPQHEIGIVQTQEADQDGHPFLASHLQALDYTAHWDKAQYFVRAFYQIGYEEPGSNSMLQEMFDSPVVVDPNLRTLAVEITGFEFDRPEHAPSDQKLANTAGLVWALMKYYRIPLTDVLGHHEIQLGKSDPGKIFLQIVRLLVALLALADPDPRGWELVYLPFHTQAQAPDQAVRRLMLFLRSYLVLVAGPRQVYTWEGLCRFWQVHDRLAGIAAWNGAEDGFSSPTREAVVPPAQTFLEPINHEGADLVFSGATGQVRMIGEGQCLYVADTQLPHWQRMALFRHRQPDGAEIIGVYSHLDQLAEIQVGRIYPQSHPVGFVLRPRPYQDAYMHFAVAYGATWDTDLSRVPIPPLNAGAAWIRQRYMDPIQYLADSTVIPKKRSKGLHYD